MIMDLILEMVKRFTEGEEKSRKFAVALADSYLRRISRFQDQLVLMGVFLNFLAACFIIRYTADGQAPLTAGIVTALVVFAVNLLLAKLYSNEHLTTKLLFSKYPELELIMVGDKHWSNFRVLANTYKCMQAVWMLYAAFLTASAGLHRWS